MNTPALAFVLAAALAATVPARAQDVVKAAPESNKVRLDNAHVRVVEASIAPGAKEGLHTHPAGWYYVAQGGTLAVEFADGRHETWSPKTGESGWSDAEGPHTSKNTGKTTLVWTLVEDKGAAAPAKH